jgi:signal peptidase
MKKVLEAVVTTLCAVAILLGLVALVAKSPIANVIPGLAKTTPMVVMSGSMVPRLPVGGLVFVKPVDVASVRVGDIIAFTEPHTGTGPAPLTTHRVVSVDRGDSGVMFRTKGDANSSADPQPVPASAVVGIAGASVPLLGYLSVFVRSWPGFALLVAVPAAGIVGYEVLAIVEELRRERDTADGEAGDLECADSAA